ncbi:MAG TPA: hypothetical protein VNQ77_14400 [Frankiaceae bacterium]|nr:hypothetical protein [Frankiaceae bacterium]
MDHNDAGLAWEILLRYADPATAEFDAVLAGATLPEDVARALRFWQRESVANVKQYAAEALPAVFGAIHDAQRDAAEATRRAGVALAKDHEPRTPGESPWAQPPPPVSITLPDASPPPGDGRLEERRRTVAARLAELG